MQFLKRDRFAEFRAANVRYGGFLAGLTDSKSFNSRDFSDRDRRVIASICFKNIQQPQAMEIRKWRVTLDGDSAARFQSELSQSS